MANVMDGDRLFGVGEADAVQPLKAAAGAAKTFRAYDQHQSFLLPPSLDDWLPDDHTARFVSEIVDDSLDLTSIYASHTNTTGAPPFDPRMMLKLLLYAYSTGVTSSREVERRCHVDVAFRWLSANTAPDYRSLARFRRRHLKALNDLFTQVLVLCAAAGLVKLGRVALDGTKLRASASRHKAMSYDRLTTRIPQVEAEVAKLLAEAEQADVAEDVEFGVDRRGDEVGVELATREARLVTMRAAKAALEADAAERAAQAAEAKARKADKSDSEIGAAVELARSTAVVNPKAQRSFTDADARMMKTNHGFHYAYNAQAVADDDSQVVVVTWVTQQPSDVNQLLPMLDATRQSLDDADLDTRPDVVLADAGYCSTSNIDTAHANGDNVLVATGRLKHHEQIPDAPRGRIPNHLTSRQRMARRLRTKKGRADYARRKAIIEPVFGQMKVKQNAGHLRLRGLDGAQGEFTLHAICHNLRKLANHTPPAIC
jgi:transposase